MHHVKGGINASALPMPARLILTKIQLHVLEHSQFARRSELAAKALFLLDQALLMLSDNMSYFGHRLVSTEKTHRRCWLDIFIHPPWRVGLGQVETAVSYTHLRAHETDSY